MKIAILSFYSGMNQRGVERWVNELSERLSENHQVVVYQNKSLKLKDLYNIVAVNIKYEDTLYTKSHSSIVQNLSSNPLDSGCVPLTRMTGLGDAMEKLVYKVKKLLKIFHFLFLDYKSLKVLQFTISITKQLIRNDYDIIIPTDGGWESAIVRILTWIKRKKMIIVGHAGKGWDDINNLWCFPDVFVALSGYAKTWAKNINPFIKIKYIPDAVDEKIFSPGGIKINLPLKKPIVICVSALEEGKRVDRIIKAIANTKDISLLVCGKGELKKELSELGKRLLGERFLLKSYSFDEMPTIYRSADIFVSATKPFYSFEMVITEAMSCNLPIVANNDPIRAEIIGDAGILCDPENIGEFADTIGKALKKDWRDKPRKQAERFSWDVVYKNYEDLFKRLVKK